MARLRTFAGIGVGLVIGIACTAIVLALTDDNDGAHRAAVLTLRSGDELVDPRTGTRCVAAGEGGLPNLDCRHTRRALGEVVFWNDDLQVYGPGSEEMTPTYSFPWWGGTSCRPPRGPGDKNVHSTDLVIHGISCATGRTVALSCWLYSYGHSGPCTAARRRWRCTSTNPGGSRSEEQCYAGRKSLTIVWTD